MGWSGLWRLALQVDPKPCTPSLFIFMVQRREHLRFPIFNFVCHYYLCLRFGPSAWRRFKHMYLIIPTPKLENGRADCRLWGDTYVDEIQHNCSCNFLPGIVCLPKKSHPTKMFWSCWSPWPFCSRIRQSIWACEWHHPFNKSTAFLLLFIYEEWTLLSNLLAKSILQILCKFCIVQYISMAIPL